MEIKKIHFRKGYFCKITPTPNNALFFNPGFPTAHCATEMSVKLKGKELMVQYLNEKYEYK